MKSLLKNSIIHFVLFGVVLFAFQKLNGQVYQPMAVDGATWFVKYVHDHGESTSIYKYHIYGDVEWNGKMYKKIYAPYGPSFSPSESQLIAYIRDDINEKKIYIANYDPIYYNYYTCDSTTSEVLWYDFNLEVGDYPPECGELEGWQEVIGINTDTLFGYQRRYLELEGYNHFHIEGIGSTKGLFHEKNVVTPGFYTTLIDFCIGEYEDCYNALPTSTTNIDIHSIKVYPNPATDFIYIDGVNVLQKEDISIFNIQGQAVENYSIQHNKIEISDFVQGMYVLRIRNRTHRFLKY